MEAVVIRAALLAVAGVIAACGPDPDCGLRVCDIRDPGCQLMVAQATACLRDEPPVQIPIDVVSYQDYLAGNVAAAPTGAEGARFALAMRAYSMLQLSPAALAADEAARQQSWAAAFYSFDRKITIIDRGEPMASRMQVALLVHEYAHALQDAHRGLVPLLETHAKSYDRELGVRAVIEGDASVTQDLASLTLFGAEAGEVPWKKVFDRWGERARAGLAASEAPILIADAYFIYPFGTPLLFEARRQGALSTAWEEVPQSARQVQAGFGAPEPGGGPWVEDLGGDAVPVLSDRYRTIEANSLGSWVLEAFLSRVGAEDRGGPARLRGDVLSIQHDAAADQVVVCWRLRFADEASAAALRDSLPPVWSSVSVNGRDVVILRADGGPLPVSPETVRFRSVAEAMPAPAAPPAPSRVTCPRRDSPLAESSDLN